MKKIIPIIILQLLVTVGLKASAQQAMPYFRIYDAKEYNAHNRNFDVLCCDKGRVLIANFEGLLSYDGAAWRMVHSPAISRITSLYRDVKGRIWVGGHNLIGTVTFLKNDSVKVDYISEDKTPKVRFGEINNMWEEGNLLCFSTVENQSYRVEGNKIRRLERVRENTKPLHKSIILPGRGMTYYATQTNGVIKQSINGSTLFALNQSNGLCSNAVNAIDYDGKGTIWGVTDNGIFRMSTTSVYTRFDEDDGLIGQVTSIMRAANRLYVGTMTGLYCRQGNRMERVQGINQACWQMAKTPNGKLLAATPEGLFEITAQTNSVRQLTTRHTLSVLSMDDGSCITGEMTGCYILKPGGGEKKVIGADNVITLERDKDGRIWAQTLYGEAFVQQKDGTFAEHKGEGLSRLFRYQADNGYIWTAGKNGKGLSLTNAPKLQKQLVPWLHALDDITVRAAYDDNGVLWIGGTYGVVRFDYSVCKNIKPYSPKLHIRSVLTNDRNFLITFSLEHTPPIGKTLYAYRLNKGDEWSAWGDDPELAIPNVDYGHHELQIRAMNAYGEVVDSEVLEIYVPFPIFVRWYFLLLYVAIIAYLIYLYNNWRTKVIRERNEKLEAMVAERTEEVIKQKDEIEQQKDEIEQQAHQLRDTLHELENAQNALLRQEREATMGKLTYGLIDRILNPLNYITNFSHLTKGLVGNIMEDIEDEKEAITQDTYEDCEELVEMATANLNKIEDHGMATARILKSMEEMMRERKGTPNVCNFADIVSKNYEMILTYYNEDIKKLGVQVEWEKPSEPANVLFVAEHVSKCIMSLVNNSFFAINKMAERNHEYKPVLRLKLTTNEKDVSLSIYDNGIGIEDNIRDKIFDPFFTTKPTAIAAGVGLYLSQMIVQDYGGKITMQSEIYKYSEFTITFPKA